MASPQSRALLVPWARSWPWLGTPKALRVGALVVLLRVGQQQEEGVLATAAVLQVEVRRVYFLLLLQRLVLLQQVQVVVVLLGDFRVLELDLLEVLERLRLVGQVVHLRPNPTSDSGSCRRDRRADWGSSWCERETKQLRSGDQNVAALPCASVNLESK